MILEADAKQSVIKSADGKWCLPMKMVRIPKAFAGSKSRS
jgi:hypothetical protein